jgi:hypothetical protein
MTDTHIQANDLLQLATQLQLNQRNPEPSMIPDQW